MSADARSKVERSSHSEEKTGESCGCSGGEESLIDQLFDDDESQTFGGAPQQRPVVVTKHTRPLSESIQIGFMVILVIAIIAAVITISVKKPEPLTSFYYGLLMGALSGATVYWVLGSRRR